MSFLEKLKARTVEAAKETMEKMFVSDEIKTIRINICNECPRLFEKTRTCKECGCFVDAKARLSSSSCPLKKW